MTLTTFRCYTPSPTSRVCHITHSAIPLVRGQVTVILASDWLSTSPGTPRTRRKMYPRRKAVITISCVCWIFTLSYVPVLTVYGISSLGFLIPDWLEV